MGAIVVSDFWIELIGYGGTVATAFAYGMRTIVPLRIAAILSSAFFVLYAILIQALPMLVTELVILPLNIFRLVQVLKLTRQVEKLARDDVADETFKWLEPFGRQIQHKAGEVLFRAGEAADHLLMIKSGRFRLEEAGIELGAGQLVGELGFLSPGNLRTMTLICIEDGESSRVSYDDIRQLYFQNPKFGFFLLQLVGERLFDNLERARSTSGGKPTQVPATGGLATA